MNIAGYERALHRHHERYVFRRYAFTILAATLLTLTMSVRAQDASSDTGTLALPGDALYPEGIFAAENGDLFVTGFGNGSILKITDGENVEVFKEAGADGLSSAVGLHIDEANRRLWVANFTADTGSSDLKIYDVASGELLASLAAPNDVPHFFNEIALDEQGNAYVSDTLAPIIWRAGADLSTVEIFVQDPLLDNPDPGQPFSLNGLAITPDGGALIASVMDRIDQGDGRLSTSTCSTKRCATLSS